MNISKDTRKGKVGLLKYFRDRSNEFLAEVNNKYGIPSTRKRQKN